MIKTKSCTGCKAVCPTGCALGVKIKRKKIGYGMDQRIFRIPQARCHKPLSMLAFRALATHYG